MFNSIIPTLKVKDSVKSEELFNKLGFKKIWEHRDNESSPRFVELGRDKTSLFLSEHDGDGPAGVFLYFLVDDAEQLHEEAKKQDMSISVELHTTEWKHIMFEMMDFDNNTLRFGSPKE